MYDYAKERPKVFLEENQEAFLRIRDKAFKLISIAGAAMMEKLVSNKEEGTGDVNIDMACIDRLVEIGDLEEVFTAANDRHRIFIRPIRI